jgi:transposase
VLVERVFTAGRSVRVQARTCGSAACPGCGAVSHRVHSRYERRLLDTAAGGREVVICLAVRRFFCRAPGCAKVTFAEQVAGLTSAHARRSPGLTGVLQAIALTAGGRAGARLSGRLAAGVSRMTLIRCHRQRRARTAVLRHRPARRPGRRHRRAHPAVELRQRGRSGDLVGSGGRGGPGRPARCSWGSP